MRNLGYTLLIVCLIQFSNSAWALKFLGDRCEYTQAELSNPDTVINFKLKGDERYCTRVGSSDIDLYPKIDLPGHGKWPPIHPQKLSHELAARYGMPEDPDMFEPYGGAYREYKIRDKKPYPPIDGHETLEYSVEILYVMRDWYRIPKVSPHGLIPACERNIVKLYAVKAPQGWYMVLHPGLGSMHDPSYRKTRERYQKSPELRRWIPRLEEDIKREEAIINQCKDHLE